MEPVKNGVNWDNSLPYPATTYDAAHSLTQPPPYAQAPPPYTTAAETDIHHISTGQPDPTHFSPQPMAPQGSHNMNSYPQSEVQDLPQSRPVNQATNIQLQNTLLQPGPSRIVQITKCGHRKQKSFVTDTETGQQFIVKEKTSLSGHRHKTVIKEVGGPKTIVKKTPRKTVVKQKN